MIPVFCRHANIMQPTSFGNDAIMLTILTHASLMMPLTSHNQLTTTNKRPLSLQLNNQRYVVADV